MSPAGSYSEADPSYVGPSSHSPDPSHRPHMEMHPQADRGHEKQKGWLYIATLHIATHVEMDIWVAKKKKSGVVGTNKNFVGNLHNAN